MKSSKSEGNIQVEIEDLLLIVDTEKAFGVLTYNTIYNEIDAANVKRLQEVKDRFSNNVVWIPKSQVHKVDQKQSEIFPNLQIGFKSKFDPNLIPWKTSMTIRMPKWLADNKGFTEEGAARKELKNDTPSDESNSPEDRYSF